MARNTGIIKLKGTLQELTFYKTQDGHLVKTKSGVPGDRILNDPNFQRTRENGSEFGSATNAGKLLRDAVRVLMKTASDNRVTSRVTQLMTIIKNYDTDSARGESTVGVGILAKGAANELKNFKRCEQKQLFLLLQDQTFANKVAKCLARGYRHGYN